MWVWSRCVIYFPLFTAGKQMILEVSLKIIIHCYKLMLTSMMWRSTASKVMKWERWETRLCHKVSNVKTAPPPLKPCWIKDTMNTWKTSKDNRQKSQAPRYISIGNWRAQHMSEWSKGYGFCLNWAQNNVLLHHQPTSEELFAQNFG